MQNKIFQSLRSALLFGLLSAISIALFGCAKEEPSKDAIFAKNLERVGRTLQPGENALVPVPGLDKTELLVAVNGSYATGSIKSSVYLSEQLAKDIFEYNIKGANYILFVRDQTIKSETGLSGENVETMPLESLGDNAKVAHSGTRNAKIRCEARVTKPTIEIWNQKCRVELLTFE